jgi:phage terminase large subunit-like protein
MSQRWPAAHLKLVEDKANGPAIIDALRNELNGIVAVSVQGSKEARVHAAAPDLEAGN